MPASWAEKLREMTARLENGIAAGDRRGNVLLLQRELFPYMADYVGAPMTWGCQETFFDHAVAQCCQI